jgi:hypothetical protein
MYRISSTKETNLGQYKRSSTVFVCSFNQIETPVQLQEQIDWLPLQYDLID